MAFFPVAAQTTHPSSHHSAAAGAALNVNVLTLTTYKMRPSLDATDAVGCVLMHHTLYHIVSSVRSKIPVVEERIAAKAIASISHFWLPI